MNANETGFETTGRIQPENTSDNSKSVRCPPVPESGNVACVVTKASSSAIDSLARRVHQLNEEFYGLQRKIVEARQTLRQLECEIIERETELDETEIRVDVAMQYLPHGGWQ